MSDSKTSSRSGSRANLNESSLPLLEAGPGEDQSLADDKGHTPEKECIELITDEKDDSSPEKTEDKSEKKEKKKAKKEKKEKCGSSCLPETLAGSLDLSQSDAQGINDFVNVDFSHVLDEPTSTQTFEPFWRVSGLTFRTTHRWVYRLLSAPLALPLAIAWGVLFAVISLVCVWLMMPVMRILQLVLSLVKQVVEGVSQAVIEPVSTACGAVFSRVRIAQQTHSV